MSDDAGMSTTPIPPMRSSSPLDVERLSKLEAQLASFSANTERRLGEAADSIREIAERFSADVERIETQQTQRMETLSSKIEAKFDGISAKIAPKPIRPLELFAVAVAVGGFIWSLSRYPDRVEFGKAQDEYRQLRDDHRDTARDVRDLKETYKDLAADLKRVTDTLRVRPQ